MRLPRIFLLLAALGLASCAGRERGPLFLDGQGGAQRIRPAGEAPSSATIARSRCSTET